MVATPKHASNRLESVKLLCPGYVFNHQNVSLNFFQELKKLAELNTK
jgi:hypothetical protein